MPKPKNRAGKWGRGPKEKPRKRRPAGKKVSNSLSASNRKALEDTIKTVAGENPSFVLRDVFNALPKGLKKSAISTVWKHATRLRAEGKIKWNMTTTPGHGGRRPKAPKHQISSTVAAHAYTVAKNPHMTDEAIAAKLGISMAALVGRHGRARESGAPVLRLRSSLNLIRLYFALKEMPEASNTQLSKRSGIVAGSINHMETKINTADRYARATGTPILQVLLNYYSLKRKGKLKEFEME